MPHFQPNHGNALPSRCIFMHCDWSTVGNWQKLNAGIARYVRLKAGKKTRQAEQLFAKPIGFWNFLKEKCEPKATTWIISHNLPIDLRLIDLPGQFDSDADPLSKGAGMCVLGDPPNILCLSLDGTKLHGDWIRSERKGKEHYRKIVFVDIRNWLRMPIQGIADMMGMERDHIGAEPRDIQSSLHNCRETVAVLEAAFHQIIDFNRTNSLGNFRFTIASQAMAAFMHGRMPTKIVPRERKQKDGTIKTVPVQFGTIHPPNEQNVKALERKAYFGGHIECWRIGKVPGKFWHVDANSLYLSVMQNEQFPIRLSRYSGKCKPVRQIPDYDPCKTVCRIFVNARRGRYPKRNGIEVIFPIGRYWTTLAGPELNRAIKNGDIELYGEWTEYDTDQCLSAFAHDCLSMREAYRRNANNLGEALSKLLGNSLSGKFAEKSGQWVNVDSMLHLEPFEQTIVINMHSNKSTVYRRICDTVQRKTDKGETQRSFPAISAFITAYGRERMLRFREIAGHENIAYQGTDSLIVNRTGMDNLSTANKIHKSIPGMLKIETTGSDLHIKACGVYHVGSKSASCGIKADAVPLGEDIYQQREFCGVDKLFHAKDKSVIQITERSMYSGIRYTKGRVLENGYVVPIELDEKEANG